MDKNTLCLCRVVCRCAVLACAWFFFESFTHANLSWATERDALAPPSHVQEDAAKMAMAAIVSKIHAEMQRGEILEDKLWWALEKNLQSEPPEIRSAVELDRGLPVRMAVRSDGAVILDAMIWVHGLPLRFFFDGKKQEMLPAKPPPLLQRVIARGGRLLDREIPPGSFKTILEIIRKQHWNDLMIIGGVVRNLLLERENIDSDLDLVARIRLSDDEKWFAGEKGITPQALRKTRFDTLKMQMESYFHKPLENIVVDGAGVDVVGILDENETLAGGLAKDGEESFRDIPGISINRIGIEPNGLRIFDPVGGLRDLAERRLKFSGKEWNKRLDYHQVFRVLRLQSQLAPYGMRLDVASAEMVKSFFHTPLPSFRLMMDWAGKVAKLKGAIKDLEIYIAEVRRIQNEGGDSTPELQKIARMLAVQEMGGSQDIPQDVIKRKMAEAKSLVRNALVQIDLQTDEVSYDPFGIGSYVLKLYQGAEDPEGITSELKRIGADVLLRAVGVNLGPFTDYARRVLVENRVREMNFAGPTAIGTKMEEYRVGNRVVKLPLRGQRQWEWLHSVASHHFGVEYLKGLVPPTTILQPLRVKRAHIQDATDFSRRLETHEQDGKIVVSFAVVQDVRGLEPLPVEAKRLAKGNKTIALEKLMRNFLELHISLWNREIVHFPDNMGAYLVDEHGKILLYDLNGVSIVSLSHDYTEQLRAVQGMAANFFEDLGAGLGRKFDDLASRCLSDVVLKETMQQRQFIARVEEVCWPREGSVEASL